VSDRLHGKAHIVKLSAAAGASWEMTFDKAYFGRAGFMFQEGGNQGINALTRVHERFLNLGD